MLNTPFEKIVNVNSIGKAENPIKLFELLSLAQSEQVAQAEKDLERNLIIAIDMQNDFMDTSMAALGVPGACADVERATRFIYNNIEKITQIYTSLDTHKPRQIFHPAWWSDQNGNRPDPFTVITIDDVKNGKWQGINPIKTLNYLEQLKAKAQLDLVVWPYHCIQGTFGGALENQFANMLYFHSAIRSMDSVNIVKGTDSYSEMYGIFAPEYSEKGFINLTVLNALAKFDKIIIMGQAKSHCVKRSIEQLLEYHANSPSVTSKVYILEDCMSSIPGTEAITDAAFDEFKRKYHVNIVNSGNFSL